MEEYARNRVRDDSPRRIVFGSAGVEPGPQPSFYLSFPDAGSGLVDIRAGRNPGGTFTRATTATTVDRTGKIVSVASGVPRSYYDPTSLAYLGYLAEGARTNLALQSEDFSTTWTAVQSSVSANATVAPDGNTTADTLIDNATLNNHYLSQSYVKAASALAYTFTVWVKAAGITAIGLRLDDGVGNGSRVDFDLSAVTASAAVDIGVAFTSASGAITAYPNGWYLCSITATSNTAVALRTLVQLESPVGTVNYTGSGTNGANLWGAQLEAAAFASSYIPTTTAAVTRNADVLTYPTSGWLNAIAGTLLVNALAQGNTGTTMEVVDVNDGTTSNRFVPYVSSAPSARFFVSSGGVTQADINAGSATIGAAFKLAAAYASNDISASLNGAPVGTDTSASIPSGLTTANIGAASNGTGPFYGPISRVAYYPLRLPNTVLQGLTT